MIVKQKCIYEIISNYNFNIIFFIFNITLFLFPAFAKDQDIGIDTLVRATQTALSNKSDKVSSIWDASQAYNIAMGDTFLEGKQIKKSKIINRIATPGRERQELIKAALFGIVIRPNGSRDMQFSADNLQNYEIDHYLNMRLCEGIGREKLGYKLGTIDVMILQGFNGQ